jgi:hypothetical protein
VRVDLLHLAGDGLGSLPPCGKVALTLTHPPGAGEEIRPGDVVWPWVNDRDMVRCGTCGGYAGDCLDSSCARPHRHVGLAHPAGGAVCRAGCQIEEKEL